MNISRKLTGCAILAASFSLWAADNKGGSYLVYVGTYTNKGKSQGIESLRFDAATGSLIKMGVAAKSPDPSFLAVHPNRKWLYAVNEAPNTVSAFSINASTGALTPLNSVSSKGHGPCHLSVDHTGKFVLAANYGSGSIASFPIKEDGSLGEAVSFVQHHGSGADPRRQKGPHAHFITLSADNRFAIVCDLGLDEVLVYRFNATDGSLTPNDTPYAKVAPGAGPRHFAFHPSNKFGYVVDEMGETVTAFTWDAAQGVLRNLQAISALPKGYTGESTGAEIAAHPNGKFLYSSNRGHDSITVFAINQKKGTLTVVEQAPTLGKEPRSFAIDPTGKYLFAANQNTDTVVLFKIDQKTGKLIPSGTQVDVGAPVCVVFVPSA